MNITLEETGPHTADITLHIESADYKDQVSAEIKKQAKKASLPGFRPGKVPPAVVRKMVGVSVVIDELNKIVSQSLHEYIQEEKLEVLGDPMPKEQKKEEDFDPKGEKDMDFTFEVGLAPSFELNDSVPEEIFYYDIDIDDKFLENEIKIYKDRFGEASTPEEFEIGDTIFGKVFEVNEEGEAVEGGFEQMLPLSPNRIEDEEVFKPFVGAKLESIHDFDLGSIATDEEELKKIFFLEEEIIKEMQEKKLKFELKRLNRVVLAEMNEEFFKQVAGSLKWELGEEESLTEEDFLSRLKEDLSNKLQQSTQAHFQNELTEAFIKQHPLTFPDDFLKKWLLATRENSSEEQIESEYPSFVESLTWTLIEGKLIEKYDVKVEDEDLDKVLRKNLRRNLAMQMGQDPDDALLDSYIQYAKNDQNTMQQMVRSALTENVFVKLEEELKPQRKNIGATEFFELVNKKK